MSLVRQLDADSPPAFNRRAYRSPPNRRLSLALWLPVTPLALIISPLALFSAALLTLVPARRRPPPLRTAWAIGTMLLSLSGTRVNIDAPGPIHLRIRIF